MDFSKNSTAAGSVEEAEAGVSSPAIPEVGKEDAAATERRLTVRAATSRSPRRRRILANLNMRVSARPGVLQQSFDSTLPWGSEARAQGPFREGERGGRQ